MKTKHNVSLILSLLCALVFTITTQAQQKTKEQLKQEQEAQDLLNEAQDYLAEDNFPLAELLKVRGQGLILKKSLLT